MKVVKAVEELKKAKVKSLKEKEWLIEEGIICREGRMYILKRELKMEIICLHHDRAVARHRGRWKTTKLVAKSNKRCRKGYSTCQRNKNQAEVPVGKLMPNSIPEKPWSHILVDFIVKLPEA